MTGNRQAHCERVSRLLFHHCAHKGSNADHKHGAVLLSRLEAAQRLGLHSVWVVEAERVPGLIRTGPESWWADQLPSEAVCNLNPYLPPVGLAAAGALVLREDSDALDVLCIFRNGVWDLPKGKQAKKEDLLCCAMREVAEETGLDDLTGGPLLATTMHGYARGGRYNVKTTYWYCFTSQSSIFAPQEKEGITHVAWMPWKEAEANLGFPVLRDLMRRAHPILLHGG